MLLYTEACWYNDLSNTKFNNHGKGVWEQRKTGTEEQDFRCFSCAKNGVRVKKTKEGGGGGERRNHLQTNPWILKTSVHQQTELAIGWDSRILLTCRSKNLNFWGVRRLFTKSFNFSSPNKGWLTKSSVKQLFTEGDLLAAWLPSDSVLRGFHDLHHCGTVRWQKFWSAKLSILGPHMTHINSFGKGSKWQSSTWNWNTVDMHMAYLKEY